MSFRSKRDGHFAEAFVVLPHHQPPRPMPRFALDAMMCNVFVPNSVGGFNVVGYDGVWRSANVGDWIADDLVPRSPAAFEAEYEAASSDEGVIGAQR